jgi:hypothetical protein
MGKCGIEEVIRKHWMGTFMSNGDTNESMDIHEQLLDYTEVLQFFEELERVSRVKAYCNGSNRGGRWIFQIYSQQFIDELATIINTVLASVPAEGPALEVMAGDGKLTEFLQSRIKTQIVATDARDGRYNIAYPKWIDTLDALKSIERYSPSFIIISWEPYLSMAGIEIVRAGIPTAWIGNPEMCGHPDLFKVPHVPVRSRYALSRHDSFKLQKFKTDIFLFNCNQESITR